MTSDTIVRQADRVREFSEFYARAGEPLGPRDLWPAGLTALVGVMLHSDQPMLIAWGEELIALYNHAHAALMGDRHPAMFGQPLFEVWSDVSDLVEARFRDALQGRCSRADRLAIAITRGGRGVAAYFDISYTPIPDGDGFGGVLCLSTETTAMCEPNSARRCCSNCPTGRAASRIPTADRRHARRPAWQWPYLHDLCSRGTSGPVSRDQPMTFHIRR